MRRIVLIIAALIFLLLLIATSVLYLQRHKFTEIIAEKIIAKVEDKVGCAISYSDSTISLAPFYWQLNNVVFRDNVKGDVFLKSERVRILLDLSEVETRVIILKDLEFKDPVLSVIRYPDGKTNMEGLFPERIPLAWRVIIDQINITNGKMKIVDQAVQRNLELKDLTAQIIPDLIKKEFKATISAVGSYEDRQLSRSGLKVKADAVVNIGDDKTKSVSLNDVIITSKDGSNLKVAGMISDDGSLNLAGEILLVDKDVLDFVPDKKGLKGRAVFAGSIAGSISSPVVEGRIAARDISYDQVMYGTVSGDFYFAQKQIRLSGIESDILGGRIEGDIALNLTEKMPSYQATINFSKIKPYHIIKRYKPDSLSHVSVDSIMSGNIEARGEIPSLRTADREAVARNVHARGKVSYKDKEKVLELSGDIKEGQEISAAISGEIRDIAAYVRIPRFPLHGFASVTGNISGALDKPTISGTVTMPGGNVKGIEFDSITADLRFAGDTLQLQPVKFQRKEAIYSIYGTIQFKADKLKGLSFDLDGEIINGDPGEIAEIFFRKLPLDLKADGRMKFSGDGNEFIGTADLHISGNSAYGQRLDRGYIAATLTRDKIIFGKVRVERNDEQVIGNGWIGFRGDSKGRFQADILSDQLSLEHIDVVSERFPMISGRGRIKVTAGGRMADPTIEASVEVPQLYISEKETGPVRFIASRGEGNILITGEAFNLQYKGQIGWERDAPFDFIVRTEEENTLQPLLSLIKPSLEKDISLTVVGKSLFEGKLADLDTLRMTAILSRVSGSYSDYRVENDGEIRLTYEDRKLSLDSIRFKGEGTSLSAIGSMVYHGDINVFVNGEADLRLLSLLTPEIKYSKGTAFAAFLISGDMENPSIRGGLAIKDGTLRSATLKQTIEGANISIFFNGREIVLESMNGMIGSGTVNGSGKVTIEDFAVKEFGFALELTNAIFRYPEGLESRIDSTLILQGTPEAKSLRGEVRIKKASYEKKLNIRTLVLELQRKKVKIEQQVPFFGDTELNVHISGKKDIWINNNLAKIPVEVDLVLKGTIDHPLLFGRVEARDGTFVFSRNPFKVISATADFISPDTIRPVMDIHATTEVRGYNIDLRLSGTVDRFNLNLSSEPSLSETDILALLTVGQTAGEAAEVMKEVGTVEATAFLAAPIQDKIEDTMQDIIKIDRFQVEPYYSSSTGSEGARLTVGKRLLNERLYVTYTTGITAIEDLIKLEYFLGKNVFIVGERDELGRVSGDIKFRFEFR